MFWKIAKGALAVCLTLIPVVVGYYLTRHIPDVRYTLSEKVPLAFLPTGSTTADIAQQLEVKNLGNSPATNIVVDIDGQIVNYDISKYSAADNVQVFANRQPFEVIYSDLPPQAAFKIVFQSPVSGIDNSQLHISDSTGPAHEALSSQPLSVTALGIELLYFGSIIFYLVSGARRLWADIIDIWVSHKSRQSFNEVMKLGRPWFIRYAEWKKVYLSVFERKLDNDRYSSFLEKTVHEQILAIDRPAAINVEDWEQISRRADSELRIQYLKAVQGSYPAEAILPLLRKERPHYFPESDWRELRKSAFSKFRELVRQRGYNLATLRSDINASKPPELPDDEWARLLDDLRATFFNQVEERLTLEDFPFDRLQELDISVLDTQRRTRLEKHASDRQSAASNLALLDALTGGKGIGPSAPADVDSWHWEHLKRLDRTLKEWQAEYNLLKRVVAGEDIGDSAPESVDPMFWHQIQRFQSGFQEATAKGLKSDSWLSSIMKITKREPLGNDKPDALTENDWDWLGRIEAKLCELDEIEKKQSTLERDAMQLEAAKKNTQSLRQRVEKQLAVIHQALADPSSLGRMEDYDDTFAPGNLANLRKVVEALSS